MLDYNSLRSCSECTQNSTSTENCRLRHRPVITWRSQRPWPLLPLIFALVSLAKWKWPCPLNDAMVTQLTNYCCYNCIKTMWPVTNMFTKEPPSLDFLQAWFTCIIHSSMEENIKSLYFIKIAMSNLYQVLIWWKGAHLKTCPAFPFLTLGLTWKLWHKMKNFPVWPVQYLAW